MGHTGWSIHDPWMTGANALSPAGNGKTIFIREGCTSCHTLLPEQTQDWTYFGTPPVAGDVQGESPSQKKRENELKHAEGEGEGH